VCARAAVLHPVTIDTVDNSVVVAMQLAATLAASDPSALVT
jgi:hypothetical protein